MKKTRLIFVICALTAAVWSLPGLAQAKHSPGLAPTKLASMFDGGTAQTGSMFDGGSTFDGGSMFDGG
jgi:hypothetical protein